MIDRKSLLADLQKQVKAAETDLEQQVKAVPEVEARLRGEYEQARKLGRTAATWNAWLGERVTQVAVAWVLGTVFVRFSEDNGLIPQPYITAPTVAGREIAQARYEDYLENDTDPTYRGWLEAAFAELGAGQAGRLLFDPDHNPLYQIPLSHDGAGALLAFWREQRASDADSDATSPGEAVLVHDFTDPLSKGGIEGWDTRFLGDLYQDLSEAARKTYALLQTPEFVEEFILDRTMTPAVREFGFEELKMIDPTCGSGHFVLGAFRRLVRMWAEQHPEAGPYERVRAALQSVHGVDLNPFAVAVARFRLLVAAMAASGFQTLAAARVYEWPIQLAIGDSLIKDRQLELQLGLALGDDAVATGDPLAEFSYATEDVHEYDRILEPGRYHVVVGNPPYITVKDKKLNQLYRDLYDACSGTYALSVPFAQRFFELAKRGAADGGGYGTVGQITANSFMKREFGTKLIEEFFAHKVELTEVIDTSGAYVPGHGTPTVILVGRPREGAKRQATIRTVRSVRGEPSAPEKAEQGLVWRAIVEQIDLPGSAGQWVSVDDLERGRHFGKQPWILADGGLELNQAIGRFATHRLEALQRTIGRYAHTGNDDAYFAPSRTWRRFRVLKNHTAPLITGEDVRDWNLNSATETLFPYDDSLRAELTSDTEHLLWRNRTPLRGRQELGGTPEEIGLNWYEWSRWHPERFSDPMGISFPFVATHNHFALDRGGKVFNRHAPVIKLQEGAAEEEYIQLLGLLNSSTAGFWLKMVSHDKGSQGVNEGYKSQVWERFYEFTGTKLQEFPLPAQYATNLASEIESLARQLSATAPAALATEAVPTAPALREAEALYVSLRARMIALQEELDWQVYFLYSLHSEDLRLPDHAAVPELALGQRAFEIVLARQVEAGKASDEWFKRHGSKQITEIPACWPAEYRALVQKRIDVIESNRAIGMIERPEYKRRWATEGWETMRREALRSWLLDRIEDRAYWFDEQGNPTVTALPLLTERLSTDEDFTAVAELYAPRQDLAKTVRELLSEEHVPFVSALRYKPAGLKKRADWEHVWELQRREDAAPDEPAKRKIRERTPLPPKYTSADFLKPSYWRARGKLDVPKERFVSYGTVNVQSPELYGWAGWDHLEQALALASYVQQAGLGEEEIVPYLAGLLELQPWLDQWHGEYDPEFGASPAAEILAFRQQKQGELGLTDDALRAWRPPAATRGRGPAKKAATSKRAAAAQLSADDILAEAGIPTDSK